MLITTTITKVESKVIHSKEQELVEPKKMSRLSLLRAHKKYFWTKKQIRLLKEGIRKYGLKYDLIKSHMNHSRTQQENQKLNSRATPSIKNKVLSMKREMKNSKSLCLGPDRDLYAILAKSKRQKKRTSE